MNLALLLLCFGLQSCAVKTTIYSPTTGKRLFSTSADVTDFKYSGAGVLVTAKRLSHSTTTKAVLNGAAGVATALGTAGVLSTVP